MGDAKNQDAVDARKRFAQLQGAAIKTTVMKKLMRQPDPGPKAPVEKSLDNDVKRAFKDSAQVWPK